MKTFAIFLLLVYATCPTTQIRAQDNTNYTCIYESGTDGYAMYSESASNLIPAVSKANTDKLELVDVEFNRDYYVAVYRAQKRGFMGFVKANDALTFVNQCNKSQNLVDDIAINKGEYYACTKKAPGVKSKVVMGKNWNDFTKQWAQVSKQGYRLIDIETVAYYDNPSGNWDREFLGVFHTGTGGHYLFMLGTWEDFTKKWTELGKQSMRLIDVEIFNLNGKTHFVGVWRPGTKGHQLLRVQGWAAFEQKWQEMSKSGYRLVDVQTDIPGDEGKSDNPRPLAGYVDMHAHPMAHLAFGRKFLHGAPDIGAPLPADDKCNHNVTANSIWAALGDCNSTHGGPGTDNTCGDEIRRRLIDELEKENGAQSKHGNDAGGINTIFKEWPAFNDITHQTMWIDWVRRAHEYGLNIMVALAVNNQTLAAGVSGPGDGPTDDKGSADLQIDEIKRLAGRHTDFMEVAYSPEDLRRIVNAGKLAIIVGVEVDNIGNFNALAKLNFPLTENMVADEINRLYTKGVRYIFPIHVTDNPFGGTAIYTNGFNLSNAREYGRCWDITCATPSDNINYRYVPDGDSGLFGLFKDALIWAKIGQTNFCRELPPACPGHVNNKGLTPLGEFALKELMKKGMIIDIDHMSQKAVKRSIEIASAIPGGYPLNSGHNDLRDLAEGNGKKAENKRTREQVRQIVGLGGMMGIGWSDDAVRYKQNFEAVLQETGGKNCGLGTDMNGLVKAPSPRIHLSGQLDPETNLPQLIFDANVVYGESFQQCCIEVNAGFPVKKCWDYNKVGVAHYGLIPDFLQDVKNLGGTNVINTLNRSAEDFALMWEKCKNISTTVK